MLSSNWNAPEFHMTISVWFLIITAAIIPMPKCVNPMTIRPQKLRSAMRAWEQGWAA
jgi:hypothetical protein